MNSHYDNNSFNIIGKDIIVCTFWCGLNDPEFLFVKVEFFLVINYEKVHLKVVVLADIRF